MKIIVGALLVLSLGASYFFYTQSKKAKAQLPTNPAINQEEDNKILAQLGKVLDLPAEKPSIATIVDPAKLKDQPFFARAQKGDKVIIFQESGRIILYRPLNNKIVEVSTLKSQQGQVAGEKTKVTATPTVTPRPTAMPLRFTNPTTSPQAPTNPPQPPVTPTAAPAQ